LFSKFEAQLSKNAYSEVSCRSAFVAKLAIYAQLFDSNDDNTVAQLYVKEQAESNNRYKAEYDRIQAECPEGTIVVSYSEDFHSIRNAEGGESNCAAVSTLGDPVVRLMNALNLESTNEISAQPGTRMVSTQKNTNPDGTTYSSDADLLRYANGNMTEVLAEDSRVETRCATISSRLSGVIGCADVCADECNVASEIAHATRDGDDDDIAINDECDNQDVYDFFTKDFFRYVRDSALAFVADESVPSIGNLLDQWEAVRTGDYDAPADEPSDECETDQGCLWTQDLSFAPVDKNGYYYKASYYESY